IVADIDEHGQLSNSKVLLNGWSTPAGLAWSPDSKWLAYGLSDLDFNQEVFIQKADNSNKAINVSMHPKWDGNPVWSPDGSKLGFVSQRNNGDGDVWFAWLKQEDWERTREEWKRDDPKDNHNETEKNDIRIDPDNIHERLVQVTGFAGNEGDFVISKDGETFYFSNARDWRRDYTVERNLYAIKWDGKDKKEILGGNKNPTALALSGDGDYVFASTNGGKVMRIKAKDGKAETLAVKSKIKANYVQEREQIFEEAWRALNEGFYDPLFHGQDWQSLKEQYKPLALSASTKEDFQFIVNLMLGQLNASHMGLRRGENQKETQKEVTGRIGVTGKNLKKGGFEITSVLPSGPAAKESSQLFVGDIVQRVNGESIQPSTNFYGLFVDQVETPVLLEVNRVKGKTEEVVIWPLKSLNAQLYKAWTDERKRLTEEFSDGRLGYIHIEGMNWRSFERFERELMAAGYGKEGVVIDVRFNGGGWTTDYLMAVLNVRQHAYTIPRGAADNLQADNKKFVSHYPFGERLPLASWTKPSIALCNANSYSNAEIFSHAFKTLDIGTLVGIPTFGAVISTGGWRLVDGSTIRMPFRAWYVKATGENMELGPAVPDIIIDNSPDCKAKKKDEQLQRAVTQLLSEIDD
ncbi:MAG: PD40 domain-containing protein, partial [Cyclobacteriaceae bacterium]|nr:PD40 domain-containing protein [Cyclobacteriaceae bacterium HetDA_MAG_MS6]